MKIIAFQISESIDLPGYLQACSGKLPPIESNEYFSHNETNQYLYLFNYGVACFLGYQDAEIAAILEQIRKFSTKNLEEKMQEEYDILIKPSSFEIGFNHVTIGEPDPASIKLIMLNIAQSVALNYYSKQTARLLEDIQNYTSQLEKYGNFRIIWVKLKMFIGRALNIKNRIADNLYIFDMPQLAWNTEYLHQIDQGMKKEFSLQARTRNIQDDIKIITDNLELFTSFIFQRKNAFLEWIIILLILIEVVSLLVDKLL